MRQRQPPPISEGHPLPSLTEQPVGDHYDGHLCPCSLGRRTIWSGTADSWPPYERNGIMAKFVRRKILGQWKEGFALDLHTLSSTYIGDDEFGHPRFDTQRSEIGELLYQLKNKEDQTTIPEIVEAVERLMSAWRPSVDILVPVPPSTHRAVQPVLVLAEAISRRLSIPLALCVSRTRDVPQLKNIFDLDERTKHLENLHSIDESATRGKVILLFDDLYRSGATMNAITGQLNEDGQARNVFALAITKTRSRR